MYTDSWSIIYLFIYQADDAEEGNTHWLILLKPHGSLADKVPLGSTMIYQFAMFIKMALLFLHSISLHLLLRPGVLGMSVNVGLVAKCR